MTETTVTPDRDARRASRYLARFFLWDASSLKRVQSCGRVARTAEGVAIRVSESEAGRHAGFAGIAHCGSVWACPVCSAKIAAKRQGEIQQALAAWHQKAGRVGLVTLTMRHSRGQSLSDLWDALSDAWHAATSGRAWSADQMMFGVDMDRVIRSGARKGQTVTESRIRIIRVVEVTHGDNGWHVHIHALVLLRPGATDGDLDLIAGSMFGRWRSGLLRAGLDAPTLRRGVDARMLHGDPAAALGEYFTKAVYSAAAEVSRGDLKDAKGGNATPFGILRSLVTNGEVGDAVLSDAEASRRRAIWAEWESASKGRRQISWTVGLRAELLGVEEEMTDQEIADEESDGAPVAQVDNATFSEVSRARANWAVLAAFQRSTAEGEVLLAVMRERAAAAESARLEGIRVRLPRPDWRKRPALA